MRDWLGHRAAATPNDLAVIDADSDTRWSYCGLDAAVNETAGRLAALGVDPGEQVGMLTGTGFLSLCLLHAAQRLGVVLVPLNSRLTATELREKIEQLDLSMVVCDADTEPDAVEATTGVPVASVDEPQWEDVRSFKTVEPASVTPAEWSREDTQLIVFTSGSTGSPKPVTVTMGNLLASAVASAFRLGIDPDDRWLLTLSFYHVGGIAPIFRSTLYGTAVVLRSEFDPGQAADDIDRYDGTVVSLVPTMLKGMLDRRGTLADSLRVVLLGGAPADESLIERCQHYSIPVHPTYGMTETASQVATARPQAAFENPDAVGTPLLWTDLTIVDDDGNPVEPGETGEIVVAGPTVTPGYYGDAGDDGGFGEYGLHTGDAGYRTDDGALVVCNRIDDRIHSGGETIDPGEIVDVLRAHDEIEAAAVVGLPDEKWGERVAALVVADALTAEAVESACREQLAGYKIPKTIGFADSLPRTESGTIDRAAVTDRLAAVAADDAADERDADRDSNDAGEPPIENGRASIMPIEEPQLPPGDPGGDPATDADAESAEATDEPETTEE